MNRPGLIPEWEDHNVIMMAWPHASTDWAPILQEAQTCYKNIIKAITAYENVMLLTPDAAATALQLAEIDPARLRLIEYTTNDTWTRDYGPLTCCEPDGSKVLLDFKFNGWGLKFAADKDNLAGTFLLDTGVYNPECYQNELSFVLEGGSVESNGRGTLLSTSRCLLSFNRNGGVPQEVLREYICKSLMADRLIMLDYGAITGDDTDSHIDNLARFTDHSTIVYTAPPADPDDPDYAELAGMKQELRDLRLEAIGRPRLIELPYAGPVYDDDGERLPASYANFLITPRAVFVPVYKLDTDTTALEIIKPLFPTRDVVPVDCRTLIKQHGSLHCATMQLYNETLADET